MKSKEGVCNVFVCWLVLYILSVVCLDYLIMLTEHVYIMQLPLIGVSACYVVYAMSTLCSKCCPCGGPQPTYEEGLTGGGSMDRAYAGKGADPDIGAPMHATAQATATPETPQATSTVRRGLESVEAHVDMLYRVIFGVR